MKLILWIAIAIILIPLGWADDTPLLSLGNGIVYDAKFSPDGEYLAVETSLGIEIRDAQTLVEIAFLPILPGIRYMAFSPDGELLISADGKVWDMDNLRQLTKLPTSAIVSAFSSDGKFLVTAGGWPTAEVKLWDVDTWEEIKTFISETYVTYSSVAISPANSAWKERKIWTNVSQILWTNLLYLFIDSKKST